jgi:hypothetical protein
MAGYGADPCRFTSAAGFAGALVTTMAACRDSGLTHGKSGLAHRGFLTA